MNTTTPADKDAAIFDQKPPVRTLHDDERRALLTSSNTGVLATVGAAGYPHLSTVIYAWDRDTDIVRMSTHVNRVKARNAARDPHAALFVPGPDVWSFAVAEGAIEVSPVTTEPGDATGRELLSIFPHRDPAAETAFLEEQVTEERVVLRLNVARLYGDIIELPAAD